MMRRLETHYRDLCDIEFTIERGKLWMLQTRVGKRTAAAAFRIAGQLVDENLITMDEALSRVSGSQLALLMFPQFDRSVARELLTKGMAASPGAAVGRAVFDSPTAKAWAERGEQVVLVRKETNPDDLEGMIAANGILTARGGKTSHAAVVARGMGKTCVCGAEALDVDAAARMARVGSVVIAEGDEISIDGSTGEVFLGAMPVVPSPVETYIESGLDAALDGADDETTALVKAVDRLLTHADVRRRLAIRANADTAEDAARARSLGAQGIGLCRTEHMFLGDRRSLIERVILAGTPDERDAALDALLPLQRKDFTELLEAMDGSAGEHPAAGPAAARVPAGPHRTGRQGRPRGGRRREPGRSVDADRKLLAAVEKLHESNPMLGMRGVRLGLLTPGLFALQVRAVAEAASDLILAGQGPAGRDHGAAGGFGDGTAPGARRVRGDPRRSCCCQGGLADHPDRHDDRAAAGRADRAPDRRGRRLLLLRHQRPDPDHLGLLPRRRRVVGVRRLPGEGRVHRLAVRDHRRRRCRPAGGDRRRGGPPDQAQAEARRLRRARRRPGIDPLLPQDRAGLRVLLPVPGAGRPAGSGPGGGELTRARCFPSR